MQTRIMHIHIIYIILMSFGAFCTFDSRAEFNGIVMKDGMYYCEAADKFLSKNDLSAVIECQKRTSLKETCLEHKNTVWRLSNCFCPGLNQYIDPSELIPNKNFFENVKNLLELWIFGHTGGVNSICPVFVKPVTSFGRTVTLTDMGDSYLVVKDYEKEWLDISDTPGEQGDVRWPLFISDSLNLDLGFTHDIGHGYFDRYIPKLETFIKKFDDLNLDRGFVKVNGELKGHDYLAYFLQGKLPISEIEESGDATFFLHDLNFHSMGYLFMPDPFLKLAQRQVQRLLNFIEFFKTLHPNSYDQPEVRLFFQRVIESKVGDIDLSTAHLTQALNRVIFVDSFYKNKVFFSYSTREILGKKTEYLDVTSSLSYCPSERDYILSLQDLIDPNLGLNPAMSKVEAEILFSAFKLYDALSLREGPEYINILDISEENILSLLIERRNFLISKKS